MLTGRVYLYIILANDTLQNLPHLTLRVYYILGPIGEYTAFRQMLPCRVYLHSFWRLVPRSVYHDSPQGFQDSSSAPVYFLLKLWYTSSWRMIPRRVYLHVILVNGTPQSVPHLSGWYSSFSQMILHRVCLNVILANDTPQRVSISHFGLRKSEVWELVPRRVYRYSPLRLQ